MLHKNKNNVQESRQIFSDCNIKHKQDIQITVFVKKYYPFPIPYYYVRILKTNEVYLHFKIRVDPFGKSIYMYKYNQPGMLIFFQKKGVFSGIHTNIYFLKYVRGLY
jgi:hypothetical protein